MDKAEEKQKLANLQRIRRANLIELAKRYATQDKFAQAAGLAGGSYVSRILKDKNIGDRVARRIESALSLSPGSLDREEGDTGPAYVWPFTLTSLERLKRLSKKDLAVIDAGINAQVAAMEQIDAPRKKPGGGGATGGAAGGGGGNDISIVPGGSTKHAPLTLVRLSDAEQREADELALLRAKNPRAARRRDVAIAAVDPVKPPENRDLFEK